MSPIQVFVTLSLSCLFSYTKQTIADLLQNKVDMSQLVITKALSKTGGRNAKLHDLFLNIDPRLCWKTSTRGTCREDETT